jgi:hypothetical protein
VYAFTQHWLTETLCLILSVGLCIAFVSVEAPSYRQAFLSIYSAQRMVRYFVKDSG